MEQEVSSGELRRRHEALLQSVARAERELAEAEAALQSVDRRALLEDEAAQLERQADDVAAEAGRTEAALELLGERHRRCALQLRQSYPGSLPDQLITAILEEQAPRRIAELEWAVVRAQILKPVHVAVLNELFRRMEWLRRDAQGARAHEAELRQRAAELRQEAEAVTPPASGSPAPTPFPIG
jgi:hypothetical protein